jgi:hypothetical protein
VPLDETARTVARFTAPLIPVTLPRDPNMQEAAFDALVDVLAG